MQPCVVIAARDLEDGTRAGAEIAHFREFVHPRQAGRLNPRRAAPTSFSARPGADACDGEGVCANGQRPLRARRPSSAAVRRSVSNMCSMPRSAAPEESVAVLVVSCDLAFALASPCAEKSPTSCHATEQRSDSATSHVAPRSRSVGAAPSAPSFVPRAQAPRDAGVVIATASMQLRRCARVTPKE